jgi:PEP-CTERM motif
MRAFRASAMKTLMCTRVCRFAVLAVTIVALGPRETAADPLLMGVAGAPCTGLVASTTQNCGLFALGEPSPTQTLTGSFQADNDVALFQFVLTGAAGVSAFTSGDATALDSLIGLFSGTTGNIVRYLDVAQGAEVDAENDDIDFDAGNFNSALPVILLDPGIYILALLQTGNDFTSGVVDGIDSLLAGFSFDDTPDYRGGICAEGGCNFSLSLTVASGETPTSVPEPGTLSLVALGSAAALARRLRRRQRQD